MADTPCLPPSNRYHSKPSLPVEVDGGEGVRRAAGWSPALQPEMECQKKALEKWAHDSNTTTHNGAHNAKVPKKIVLKDVAKNGLGECQKEPTGKGIDPRFLFSPLQAPEQLKTSIQKQSPTSALRTDFLDSLPLWRPDV